MVMTYKPAISNFTVLVNSNKKLIKWVQKVLLSPNWFAGEIIKNANPPRSGNMMVPLINGERAFESVYDAINKAKISVDIVMWGFEPSMRLKRPKGERLGELILRKARSNPPVKIRILVWNSPIPGAGNPGYKYISDSRRNNPNPDDATYNDIWFKDLHKDKSVRLLWRNFTANQKAFRSHLMPIIDEESSYLRPKLLSAFPSHHQKTVLVDYESPKHAVGFVMGHNLKHEYWDTDTHEFDSSLRKKDAKPWQDLSCRVYGPILYDINSNFSKAWIEKADEWMTLLKMADSAESKKRKPEDFYKSALQQPGKLYMAQICKTLIDNSDLSILEIYINAIRNARQYIYFENQYFRYTDIAREIRTIRSRLIAEGRKQDFYVFVVTNAPGIDGQASTKLMLDKLNQSHLLLPLPRYLDTRTKKEQETESSIIPADLEGIKIIICTLEASVISGSSGKAKFRDIYVHSKLLLVDDVFFTIGSANVNMRSMVNDTEINVASPAPEIAKKLRKDLWNLHTGTEPMTDMKKEFSRWKIIIKKNKINKKLKKILEGSLIPLVSPPGIGIIAD